MKEKGDRLVARLIQRMMQHIKRRIADKNKRDHWVLKWVKKNLTVAISSMALFNYLKGDVTCLDEMAILLTKLNKLLIASSNTKSIKQRAYLYCNNSMKWICSNKVTRRGFSVRHEEHKKKICQHHELPISSVKTPARED
eukprot:6867462-Ditylum_brightwellii.AAC.1